MVLEKIKSTSNTKGFTLVELIVVITILAVLAAIAFISIGNVTGSARNSKRQNDLSSISTAIRNKVEINGMSIEQVVNTANTNVTLSGKTADYTGDTIYPDAYATYYIAGRNLSTDTELKYKAGDVNYDALGIKSTEFQDPNAIPYVVGATKLAGQVFELGASLELDGNKKATYIVGTYTPRTYLGSGVTLTGMIDGLHKKITIQDELQIGKLKILDNVVIGTTNAQITNISGDGRTISYSGSYATDGEKAITLGNYSGSLIDDSKLEPAGLIRGNDLSKNYCNKPATSDSQECIPY
ncbi:MAG: type II secretion system protein [Candidatus Gracilibacteria bacterium]|nr:type II secretion system protein [Candidatus Gracilibacteria bacterium]